MTLRQTLQAAPTKTKELIEKLSGTSNQAVKTRDSLFAELKEQLSLYLDVEEQNLLPLLRKHQETKSLASDAAKGSRDLRARLREVEAAPRDNDEFLAKVKELQTLLQQHVRDERRELLPAVLKALDDEEAASLAGAIEGGFAEAEEAKREQKRQAAALAKRETELAEQAEAAERAAARAEKAAAREARAAAKKAAEAATATMAEVVERSSEAASQAQGALASYSGTFQKATADLRAVSASTSIAAQGASQFMSAWMEWIGKATRAQAEASRRIMECTNIAQFAEVQNEILSNATRNLIERNAAFLEIAQQTSKKALSPLDAQRAR
jgi:hemerythrin-like domain-containing protein